MRIFELMFGQSDRYDSMTTKEDRLCSSNNV